MEIPAHIFTETSCMICKEQFVENDITVNVGNKGYKTLVSTSEERQDNIFTDEHSINLPLKLHTICRKDYTNQLRINARKREIDNRYESIGSPPPKLRSTEAPFNIKENCLFCTKLLVTSQKVNISPHNAYSNVETIEFLSSLIKKAQDRNDEWGEEVLRRTNAIFDLVAAEAKYHRRCLSYFYGNKKEPNSSSEKMSARGRPRNPQTENAFEKLCLYLEENDECQYSLSELKDRMEEFLEFPEEGCTTKWLKCKLQEKYKSEIFITEVPGKCAVISFKYLGDKLLQEQWAKSTSTDINKEMILEMAASIILDEIRTSVYDLSNYPQFLNGEVEDSMVPKTLAHFMRCLIKSKCSSKASERRQQAISHAIIAACRPRSFISPILLSLAVYVHRKYESKELINILSSLGFSEDYKEVRRLIGAFLIEDKPEYPINGFTQFVFDNADFNVATLTGHNTVHNLGGIAAVTPVTEAPEKVIPRPKIMPDVSKLGKFGHIEIKRYNKPVNSGLKSTVLGPLKFEKEPPLSFKCFFGIHYTWLLRFSLSQSPNWSGFMQAAVQCNNFEQSRIIVLPFVNLDPGNLSTLYTALSFAQNECNMRGIQFIPVTFDQPLYIKAVEIVESSPHLRDNIFVRLGGFHLLMSYMGSIGYIMSGSGLEELWEQVYAGNTVVHMMAGHAYSRALRAHLLTSSALLSHFSSTSEFDIDIDFVEKIHEELLKKEANFIELDNNLQLQDVVKNVDKIMSINDDDSRTVKLWKTYFKMANILCIFLFSERVGDWDLQKYCLGLMIPIFHAAGHLAYAKCTRLTLQQMDTLKDRIPETEYKQFTENGFFTIRRKNIYFNGNFSDQTIEQDLMRSIKAKGGLGHGRGITESTISQWVHSMPYCIPICQYLEEFTGVFTSSSEQHKDLRPKTQERDQKDLKILLYWINDHSPLSYSEKDELVSVATGEVANDLVNCDSAYEIGAKAAEKVTGKDFPSIKLKRNDKVVSFNSHKQKITVRGKTVDINPSILFSRITCVLNTSEEMEDYLSYELSLYPPALFKDGLMRKNRKGALGEILLKGIEPKSIIPSNSSFIIDGGYLLHKFVWSYDSSYLEICQGYVDFILNNFGLQSSVVFDGYESVSSTKAAEQARRATKGSSPDIYIKENMINTTNQQSFLANSSNKSRLIIMLKKECENKGIATFQAEADADYLLASKVVLLAAEGVLPVVLVGNDTDLLILLVKHSTQLSNVYLMKESNPVTLYKINEIQEKIPLPHRAYLVVVHCLTGCDTTSAFFRKGKRIGYNVLMKMSTPELECLKVFIQEDSSKEAISQSGEKFYLKMYGSNEAKTLNRLRYLTYLKCIKTLSLKSDFSLESLPPTSTAAEQHSYRVYHTVQQNQGKQLPPKYYGWNDKNGVLSPATTAKPLAPENLLKMISCGCKCGCNKTCGCRKMLIPCTAMCSPCHGDSCSNAQHEYVSENDDV